MNGRSRAQRHFRAMTRPRILLPLFLATCLIDIAVLRPWMVDWGANADERQMALPGNELVPRPAWQFTRAITIAAPAGEAWRWLVQLGQDRAGHYPYDWLENMTGVDIQNGNTIRPEWQPRADTAVAMNGTRGRTPCSRSSRYSATGMRAACLCQTVNDASGGSHVRQGQLRGKGRIPVVARFSGPPPDAVDGRWPLGCRLAWLAGHISLPSGDGAGEGPSR
jgi:hypothetical protein